MHRENPEKLVRDHTIVALDVDTIEEAIVLVETLGSRIDKYKVGSRLFTKYGVAILETLHQCGVQVFLDLKFHDIPSVVGDACRNAASHPAVFLVTVHANGGGAMLKAAMEGAKIGRPSDPPKIVAVTALTSMSEEDVQALGIKVGLGEWAKALAHLALDAGVDGLVCSPHELSAFRATWGSSPLLVTPGIRPQQESSSSGIDDQVRVMTPREAIALKSDYLVIGRPIYQAPDPAAAVDAIVESLR